MYLQMLTDKAWTQNRCQLVTTDLLGKAKTPDLPYVKPDGSAYRIDTDYLGNKRDTTNPGIGPLEYPESGELLIKVR